MKIINIPQYILSENDAREMNEISNMAILPYMDIIKSKLETPEEQKKIVSVFNMMECTERVFTRPMIDRCLLLIGIALGVISNKKDNMEKSLEKKHGWVDVGLSATSPAAYYRTMINNYALQINSLKALAKILTVENPNDEYEQ